MHASIFILTQPPSLANSPVLEEAVCPPAAFSINTNLLGLGVGSTFWWQNASHTSSYLVSKLNL